MRLRELKLELTQQCPLACVHCSTDSHSRRTSALPEQAAFRLIREAATVGVEKIAFSGGEPLLAPYLPRLVQECRARGIHTSLYTCGIADFELKPLTAEAAAALARNGLGRFIFSIYSHRADVHNSITRFETFSSTIAALRNAITTSAPVEIHFVAMRRNFRDVAALVEAASGWGVRRLSVLRFVPHGRGETIAHGEDLTADEMRELRELILAARAMYPQVAVRAGSPLNILGIGHTPCDAAQDVLTINHRGQVFPCDAFKNVKYEDSRYGSVLNRSLAEVWERSAFLNHVRDELAAGPMQPCGSCSEYSGCKSGCLAQKVIREGWAHASGPDPGCLVQISATPQEESADQLLHSGD